MSFAPPLLEQNRPHPLSLLPHGSPPIRRTDAIAEEIWRNGQSGMFISGDPGSGKSVMARRLIRSMARQADGAIIVIDPAGDLAKAVWRDCLAMGRSVARRTQYVAYGDTETIVPIHPLHVRRTPEMNDLHYGARLSCRVSHCAHLLLSAWGQESWDGTPLLFKWTTLFLKSLALMGLPMAEVKNFLNPYGEIYAMLAEHVPDLFAQLELQLLASLRPDKVTEQIQSTANRFLGFFDNPLCEAILGVHDADRCLNVHESINELRILIIDLESRGVLREEDQKILANLILAEVFHDVFSRPEHERRNVAIICDELPVFTPSFKMIEINMRLMRKTLTRFFGICQGSQSFPDGEDSPLLQAMLGGTGIKAIFRHVNPRDTKLFGDLLATPLLNPLLEKFRHTEMEQYQDGNEIVELVDRSINQGHSLTAGGTEGGGEDRAANWSEDTSNSTNASVSDTNTNNHSLNDSYSMTPEMQIVSQAYHRGTTQANATSSTQGTATTVRRGTGGSRTEKASWSTIWQRQDSEGNGITYKQQLVPILRWREVLRMMEFFSLDDQKQMMGTEIANQPTFHFILYTAGIAITRAHIRPARDPFEGTPRTLQRRLAAYFQDAVALPFRHAAAQLMEYRRTLIQNVLRELRELHNERPGLTRGQRRIDFPNSDRTSFGL